MPDTASAAVAAATATHLEVPDQAAKNGAGAGTYVGWAGAVALIGALDQLLKNNGNLAATTLTHLGPFLGPVWGNWPLLALLGLLGYLGFKRWRESQTIRAAADAAAVRAFAELTAEVRDVSSGLGSVRAEVHSVASGLGALRADLRNHAEQTEERFRQADTSIREFVRAEIVPIRERVAVLESHSTRKPRSNT